MRTLFLFEPHRWQDRLHPAAAQQINTCSCPGESCPGGIYHPASPPRRTCAGAGPALPQPGAQQAGPRAFLTGGDGTFSRPHRGLWLCRHRRGLPAHMAAAMTSTAPLGRGRSFWTWIPNWRGGGGAHRLMQTNLGLSATIVLPGWTRRWPTASQIPAHPAVRWEVSYLLSIIGQLCRHIGRRVDPPASTVRPLRWTVRCVPSATAAPTAAVSARRAEERSRMMAGWMCSSCAKLGRLTIAKLLKHVPNGRHSRTRRLVGSLPGKAWLHLPPGQGCDPARRRWTRAHHCHSGRRMCPLRAGARGGAAAGRPRAVAAARLPALYRQKGRREVKNKPSDPNKAAARCSVRRPFTLLIVLQGTAVPGAPVPCKSCSGRA